MYLSVTKCSLNKLTFLHTVFAAEALLAEGQLLHEEPTANRRKSLKFEETGSQQYRVSNGRI
jgi:hypothetical protein